jgi:4-amino-4-deoxy-L-arabinose transferase-like glycosyltransferase
VSIISSEIHTYPRSLLLVLILGLLLRVVFISFHERPLFSDEKEYDQLGYNLATKASYSYDTAPTAYRPIGYPALVGFVYFIFGHYQTLVKLIQALLDTAISFLVYLLLTGYPRRTRVLGAALWVFFTPAVFYASLLLSETFFTFLFVLNAWLMTRNNAHNDGKLVVLGALLGILTLIKPTVVVFAFVLLFLIRQFEIPLKKLYLIGIAFVLVLTPWLARNYLVFGEVALTSNGGINLMIGNNATSTGAYKYAFDPILFHDSKGEFDVDHKAWRYAVSYIVSNPTASLINVVKKIGRLCESEGGLLVVTFHDDPEDSSTQYGTKYASLPIFWILLTNLPFFLIVLAGVFGFLSAERGRLWWFVLAAATSWLVIHAVFFGGGRFHFPLMPLTAVYAAQFLSEPRKRYEAMSAIQKRNGFVLCTLFCLLWLVEAYVIFHG